MKKLITLVALMLSIVPLWADTFDYTFRSVRLSEALNRITEDHPSLILNFIYNELDNYKVTARIDTDNPYEAIRQTVGQNPVSVIKKGDRYYVEAMQRGRYIYSGRAVGSDNDPVAAATVMLLEPKDSTVITFGITDAEGRFAIPCDREGVIGKLTCLGYRTRICPFTTFDVGTITMELKAVALGEVKVEADNAQLYADKSVYLPTAKQKNASQSGSDLLSHMAIPQLGLSTSNSIVTNSGKPVAVFIDYLPASESDLKAMRIADVKRVEYYEYPSDPRLQGNPYVINFIMQKYDVGGYFKGFAHTNLISTPIVQGLGNLRLQYKKITYDIMGSVSHYDRHHDGVEVTETFRLPQPSGELKEFTRFSNTTGSRDEKSTYFALVRATYSTDDVQASSRISGSIDSRPHTDRQGTVSYRPADYPASAYSSQLEDCSRFIAYKGYYFFVMPHGNSLTFNPAYMFSHTVQNSLYTEQGFAPIRNGATDNTNQLSADVKMKHDFGRCGNLTLRMKGSYEYNRTRYTGSASALDKAMSSRLGVGASYDITIDKVYGQIGFGWDWDRLQFSDMVDRPSSPSFNISLQYSPGKRQSFSALFEYESWLPLPSFKSDKIIEASPLLSYTGNPNLTPAKSYDFDLSYTWIPNNNFNLNAYSWGWIVSDRYVYDYEATADGVLRTIKQPMGVFAQGMYGVKATASFLDRSMVFTGNLSHLLNHNGKPYNVNHTSLSYYVRASYYLGNWNFRATYSSGSGSADGCMNGIWQNGKSDWYVTVTWGNEKWNIRGDLWNFTQWSRRSNVREMNSTYYSTREQLINGDHRAFVQLSATYTFGFGKKVQRSDQPSVSGAASSGILK